MRSSASESNADSGTDKAGPKTMWIVLGVIAAILVVGFCAFGYFFISQNNVSPRSNGGIIDPQVMSALRIAYCVRSIH